jgi:hypothetical protein
MSRHETFMAHTVMYVSQNVKVTEGIVTKQKPSQNVQSPNI